MAGKKSFGFDLNSRVPAINFIITSRYDLSCKQLRGGEGEGGGGGVLLLPSESLDLLCFTLGDHRISAAKIIRIYRSAPLRAVRAEGRKPNRRISGQLLQSVSLLRLFNASL